MVERNAPCPCGSGRKYKHCCLTRASQPPPYTREQRKTVLDKLWAFLDSPDMEFAREEALDEFWGPLREAGESLPDSMLRAMSEDAFNAWFAYDRPLEDGRRPVEHFLECNPVLGMGGREYLAQAAESCMRLYEVVQVVPETSLTLRDLQSGSEVIVRERSGTRTIKRWDILATRIMPRAASGWPEMDGGTFHLPRLHREALLGGLGEQIEQLRQDNPAADEAARAKSLVPFFHQAWIGPAVAPRLPDLQTSDGQELIDVHTYFEVLDRARVAGALDTCRDFERQGDEAQDWVWLGRTGKERRSVLLGHVTFQGNRLVLETFSRERAERGRAVLERLAGDALRYQTATHQHPAQAMAEHARREPTTHGRTREAEIPPDLQWELVSEHYQQHYRGWLDEKIPALRDHTPREASRSAELRPVLVEMLKDLENMYERALGEGQPGFDPSWMWFELGLEDRPEAPRRPPHPPLTAGEAMERFVPGIGEAALAIAALRREQPDFGPNTVIDREELGSDLTCSRFIRDRGAAYFREGGDPTTAAAHADLIGAHLYYLVNHELHLRKTFWIDEGLAYQLGQTRLDLAGDHLRLPFASFALIFTDRYTLGLLERMLSTDPECAQRGRRLAVATAYVTEMPAGEARGLSVSLTCDAQNEQWPYLLARDLYVKSDAELESILDSHFPDVDVSALDPMFTSAPLRQVLHLVINAILYATSPGIEAEPRRPPARRARPAARRVAVEPMLSGQEVFFLPGTIDITLLRRMQQLERAPGGRGLMHRFMVRGHWRRPARSWKIQRPRWIQPYWKGPDIATVIERAYRLKP